jgi:hypothetical protein
MHLQMTTAAAARRSNCANALALISRRCGKESVARVEAGFSPS